jgi:hypothetical protein
MRVDQQGIVISTPPVVRLSSRHLNTATKAGMPRTRCKTLEVIYVYGDYFFPTH